MKESQRLEEMIGEQGEKEYEKKIKIFTEIRTKRQN